MIRFLQADNRIVKVMFVLIIAACSVGMVIYLIPGLYNLGAPSEGTYAVIYPHWYSRIFSSGTSVTQQQVEAAAQQDIQMRYPQYAGNPMILKFLESQVGSQLVERQVLVQEADQLGVHVTDNDVRQFLHQGELGQMIFPNGQYIGDDAYANLVATRFNMTTTAFEDEIKTEIAIRRLEALITAPVTVSDQAVQAAYMKQNLKIKFDYAVITADSLRNQINPSDAQLEAYFKQNAARYANAVPEQRSISYFAFTTNDLPGGVPQPTQQQIEQYYNDHKSQYTQPEEVDSRHILISVPANATPQQVSAAQAKADSILKQLKAGADFAAMAKKYSDDPGSKDKGGELGFVQKGTMVPEFDNAIFTQPVGELSIVRSQYGFHIVQVEKRQPAHEQALNEVLPEIQASLIQQQTSAAESQYAQKLTSEADKNGLDKTAAAHHLQVVTTQPLARQGTISAIPDSSQLLGKAFTTKPGDPPQSATTGDGYAIFQVKSIVPAHAPTFAEWKDHVLSDYRDQQVPGLIDAKTKELADKAQSMNDLAKAAKAVGAKVETSDLVTASQQVPDLGQVGQVAPQLFKLSVGNISGPIHTTSSGVVAKIVDKQQPTPAEMAKNLDQTREAMLQQQRDQAFNVFVSNVMNDYRKRRLIQMGKQPSPNDQGM
ncbi:MAG TPA: peptidyl-prolyl cis-trans isomerase [Terracidiphilus sp.]|nr:peptidyl-prolyl cis-trans isomerase [Terracidiphilus sp.]